MGRENISRHVQVAKLAVLRQGFANMALVNRLATMNALLKFFTAFALVVLKLSLFELKFAVLASHLLMCFLVRFDVSLPKNFLAYLAFSVVAHAVRFV